MKIPAKLGTVLYVALRLSGWLIVTLLAMLGCYVLAFLMIGGFDPLLVFTHVDNLASRYISADQVRRASFATLTAQSAVVLFAVVAIARRGSLISILNDTKEA